MKQLVELEMKKLNMNYIRRMGLLSSSVLLVYLIIVSMLSKGKEVDLLHFYNQVIAYNKIIYTLFIAALINRMFSEEMVTKSISILFTYPISRMKLLSAKIILIMFISIPYMMGSMIIHLTFITLLNLIFSIFEGTLTAGIIVGILVSACLQCILAVLTAFIILYIDVRFVSTRLTLIVAGTLAFFLYTFSGNSIFGMGILLTLVTAVVGVVMIHKSLSLVANKDIM